MKINQKGITLVALVITIVVLLILATVAIREINGQGIINHAKISSDRTKIEQVIEAIKLWELNNKVLKQHNQKPIKTLEQVLNELELTDEQKNQILTTGSITIGETTKKVVDLKNQIKIGEFVEYNVAYTDVYKPYEYTSTNGWRLLEYTDNGDGTLSNVKLISTGVPAKLHYYYNDTENSNWYVTESAALNSFRNILTNNGTEDYTFYTGEKDNYALQVSAGLYNNFGDIKFAYGTSNRGKNLGYFTKIISNGTTYNSANITETTGENLFIPNGINAKVRLLTLPEMNKIIGRTDIDSISTMTDPTGANGLFVLQNLKNVAGMNDRIYDLGYYWLASPYPNSYDFVCDVYNDGYVELGCNLDLGVRPVICINSNVKLVDTNNDNIFEIKY